jgi:hypothetical protein
MDDPMPTSLDESLALGLRTGEEDLVVAVDDHEHSAS